ncbi:MAG TPA: amino acid ABC transporter permease [Devosiaceae bacterium]|jgi:general L-amino acid transport system permease protein|nr:amino acid ABC transporter permease [Devosiaceae bacterium]
MSSSQTFFVRSEMVPEQAPPRSNRGIGAWLRANLFSTPLNSLASLIGIVVVGWVIWNVLQFTVFNAVFSDPEGLRGAACRPTEIGREVGACWIFIQARINFFIYGFYPAAETWRVNVMMLLGAILLVLLLVPKVPYKRVNAVLFFVVYPVVAFILMGGGVFGLPQVPTEQWGGLSLTLIISLLGIICSLPLGILLALGRQSSLPVIKSFCIGFIELWRAVPLITVLFMASVMFPLFMPQGVNIDNLLRAIVGIILFESAYMAEVVRGGLQALPRGQSEAASALGLNKLKSTMLIILPQALKHAIPGIVNTFIALFKDTSLVSIIGIFELLNTVRAANADSANWGAPTTAITGYLFAGAVFWIFCFSISRYSIWMEDRLNTGHKR